MNKPTLARVSAAGVRKAVQPFVALRRGFGKLGAYRKRMVGFLIVAALLVVPCVVFAKLSADTDARVVRWFLQGVPLKKVAAETRREQPYLLTSLAFGTAAFTSLCVAISFEAKHIKYSRMAPRQQAASRSTAGSRRANAADAES